MVLFFSYKISKSDLDSLKIFIMVAFFQFIAFLLTAVILKFGFLDKCTCRSHLISFIFNTCHHLTKSVWWHFKKNKNNPFPNQRTETPARVSSGGQLGHTGAPRGTMFLPVSSWSRRSKGRGRGVGPGRLWSPWPASPEGCGSVPPQTGAQRDTIAALVCVRPVPSSSLSHSSARVMRSFSFFGYYLV